MTTKIASWNVNGIRACHKNGFLDWFRKSGFDLIALQEVRATADQIPADLLNYEGYQKHWFSAQKKGYSGVGVLSRLPVKDVQYGMGVEEFDAEGRVITLALEKLFIVSAYFPNSQDKGARIDYKVRFCKSIHNWVNKLRAKGRPVVLSGDYNIAHQPIDLARPKENEGTAGYLPEERAWMTEFVESGWIDTFRHQHPDTVAYSWWSMRQNARARNVGWRIDYNAVHSKDRDLIMKTGIQDQVLGSDHCPVTLELSC